VSALVVRRSRLCCKRVSQSSASRQAADFTFYYSAALLVREGHPAAPYDQAHLAATISTVAPESGVDRRLPFNLPVGAILPLLTLATYRALLEIDRTVAPVPEVALLSRVPMFAPMSIAMKERIAANLVPVSVSAGEPVIRAGDPGDRFYIVGDGELEIDAGDLVATAHKGDYFGEIALLRDVPRTATVTAAVDSQLYALHRDDFLAAVTGHHAAHAAGHEVAKARLENARARALNG